MSGAKDILEAGGFANGTIEPFALPEEPRGEEARPVARFLCDLGDDDPLAIEPPPRRFLLVRLLPEGGAVGWLPAGEIGMLAAGGGVGKTTLACQLALSVATGGRFCGMGVATPGSVLLVLAEEDEAEVRRKLHFTQRTMGLDRQQRDLASKRIAILPLVGRSARLLEGERGRYQDAPLLRELHRFLSETRDDWRLVVLDPFARFCAPDAEVDNAVASESVRAMASLTRGPGAPTVLVLHHVTKDGRSNGPPGINAVRGAGALTDEARWAAVMWAEERDSSAVNLAVRKSNYAQPGPTIQLQRGKGGVLRLATVAEAGARVQP